MSDGVARAFASVASEAPGDARIDSPRRSSRTGARRAGLAVVALLVVYVAVATFPGFYVANGPGLDPSWRWAINFAAASGITFGSHVNFTYGPLGFLLEPIAVGRNLLLAVGFWALVQALFAAALLGHLYRRRVAGVALFCVLYLATWSTGIVFEYHLVVVLAVILVLAVSADRRAAVAAAAVAGALAGTLLFIKFSTGLGAVGMVAFAVAATIYRKRSAAFPAAAAFALGFGSVVVAVTVAYMGSLAALGRWVHASVEMSSGYSVALSLPNGLGTLTIATGAAYAALMIVVWYRRKAPSGAAATMMAPALFFAFKHSLVRHPGRFFAPLVVASVAVVVLAARDRRTLGGAAVVAIALACPVIALGCPHAGVCARNAAAVEGVRNIHRALDVGAERRSLASNGAAALALDRLPDAMLAAMRVPGATVDVVPWELDYLVANDLRWAPNPALQLYNVTTPWLDRLSAEHYRAKDRPTFVVMHFTAIDNRHPLLDTPETWRAIFENYSLVDADVRRGLFLFRSRAVPTAAPEHALETTTGRVGEWIPVPASPLDVYAKLAMRLTARGSFDKTFLSVRPVTLDVRYASGEIMTVRFTPDLSHEGMLIGGLPPKLYGAVDAFLHGAPMPVVASIRVDGPGSSVYVPTFTIAWYTQQRIV